MSHDHKRKERPEREKERKKRENAQRTKVSYSMSHSLCQQRVWCIYSALSFTFDRLERRKNNRQVERQMHELPCLSSLQSQWWKSFSLSLSLSLFLFALVSSSEYSLLQLPHFVHVNLITWPVHLDTKWTPIHTVSIKWLASVVKAKVTWLSIQHFHGRSIDEHSHTDTVWNK